VWGVRQSELVVGSFFFFFWLCLVSEVIFFVVLVLEENMFWRERERENKDQNGGPLCGQVRVLVVGDSGTLLVYLLSLPLCNFMLVLAIWIGFGMYLCFFRYVYMVLVMCWCVDV
jgi:hypothetical protein